MNHFRLYLPVLVLALCLSACHRSGSTDLITIDIDQALKTKGELKLSAIATDVEFVQLRGLNTDTYINSQSWQYFTGDKVIVVFNLNPDELLLFSRSGEFIRKIGTVGKGPGEYLGEMLVFSVDEDNETILVADNSSKKFLLYRFSGEFIREQAYRNYHSISISYAVGICPGSDGHFVIKNQISPNDYDPCFHILVLDRDLKIVQTIQPEQPLPGPNTISFGSNPVYPFGNSLRFWTPGRDTVYELTEGHLVSLYYFKISDPPGIEERMSFDNKGHIVLSKILDTPDYLFIMGSKGSEPFYLAYHKPSGKTIRIFASGTCGLPMAQHIGIENDLFGFSPVDLSEGTSIWNNHLILVLHPSYVEMIDEWLKSKLTGCLKSAEVLLPDKRDELVRLIEGLDDNSGPVLMVVKVRN